MTVLIYSILGNAGGAMKRHQFGGGWTDKKLKALSEYLTQYRLIFTANEKARFYTTIYLDGFAGTGERRDSAADQSDEQLSLTPDLDREIQEYKRGSAAVALDLESPFDQYVFIPRESTATMKALSRVAASCPVTLTPFSVSGAQRRIGRSIALSCFLTRTA